jgi:hypothetical protein
MFCAKSKSVFLFQGKIADEWTYAEFVDKTFASDTLTK